MTALLPSRLEEVLDQIGWAAVKATHPVAAHRLINALVPNDHEPEAYAAAAAASARFQKAIAEFRAAIRLLPQLLVDEIEFGVAAGAQLGPADDEVWPFGDLEDLAAMSTSIEAYLASRQSDWEESGLARQRGRPKLVRPRRIAAALAVVYRLGTGLRPTVGASWDGSGASGEFCRVLDQVLSAVKLTGHDIRHIAKEAVAAASDEAMKKVFQDQREDDEAVRSGGIRFGLL